MAEIKHNILKEYLGSLIPENTPQVFFIWGEEFLCRKVFDTVASFLLPNYLKEFGYELLEGEEAVIPVIIERLSTYSFFQKRRVIAVKNAPLFASSGSSAAPGFLNHDLDNLNNFIEKGFPENHFFVISSSNADKRRSLFNTIKTSGVVIDCTVAQGSSKAEKDEQDALLRITMAEVLDRNRKGIDGEAYQALKDMTGFDPASFSDNLERLSAFIGERELITIQDVYSVVKRSRKDPIFELTNAVAQKNLESSIFYYKSLCDNGFHPLQLLASIVNQIRKIFVVKIFITNEIEQGNICWRSNMSYQQFNASTTSFITKADGELVKTLLRWEEESGVFADFDINSNNKKIDKKTVGKKRGIDGIDKKSQTGKKVLTDLIIASNPKSTYPVYQTFLRADKFSLNELVSIMLELSEMDYRLKSSSDGEPFILLEDILVRICINGFQNKI